jgi:hypothetical protein
MKVFEVDGELDGEPAVASALVDVHLHLDELVEYLGGLAEDSVVQCTPALFTQLIYNVGFFFLYL